MYMAPQRNPPDPSKKNEFDVFESFWVRGTPGNILTSILPNYHFGKRLGAQDMTILGFMLSLYFSNIGYMGICGYLEVYNGICKYMGVYGGVWEYMVVYGGI